MEFGTKNEAERVERTFSCQNRPKGEMEFDSKSCLVAVLNLVWIYNFYRAFHNLLITLLILIGFMFVL